MLASTHPKSLIRVLLVDDQKAVRYGLEALLSTFDDIEVIGSAADGLGAVQLALELSPDVVVMDARMPIMNGIQATRRIKAYQPHTAVVLHSIYGSLREPAASLGADAFLLKGCQADDLVSTIRTVGSRLLGPIQSGSLADHHSSNRRTR